MADTKRSSRVADQIRAELSDILLRRTKDPRIGSVTVTHVELTADLRLARIFVAPMGETARKETLLQGIMSAAGFIRGELGHRLRLRYVPEVIFVLDESADRAERVMKILNELEEKKT